MTSSNSSQSAKSEELKECPTPWCSRFSAPYVFTRRGDVFGVCCPCCNASTDYHSTEAAAIAQWNTRPTPELGDLKELADKLERNLAFSLQDSVQVDLLHEACEKLRVAATLMSEVAALRERVEVKDEALRAASCVLRAHEAYQTMHLCDSALEPVPATLQDKQE